MSKGSVVTEGITIVGMIAISALMFAQVPDMVSDIKETLSKQSAHAKAVEIADYLELVGSATGDMSYTYILSEDTPYTLTVDDGVVTVRVKDITATDKTSSSITFQTDDVKAITITKGGIQKVE